MRVWELQGIEASAEVQMAARKVAEENKQLRCLLNRYGVSDEYIAHYLQSGAVLSPDANQGQPFRTGDPGPSVQSLQQLIVPRLPPSFERPISFPLPSQSSREASTASASTASSSIWEQTQPMLPSYGSQHQQQMDVSPTMMDASGHAQFSPQSFTTSGTTVRREAFPSQPPSSMLSDPRQSIVGSQSMMMDARPDMNYQYIMPPYNDPTPEATALRQAVADEAAGDQVCFRSGRESGRGLERGGCSNDAARMKRAVPSHKQGFWRGCVTTKGPDRSTIDATRRTALSRQGLTRPLADCGGRDAGAMVLPAGPGPR